MRGKPAHRSKQSKTPTLSSFVSPQAIITHSLRAYSHQNLAWLRKIDKILLKPRRLLAQINYCQPGEWLERCFKPADCQRELTELVQYYKYYKCSPLVVGDRHFEFMNAYWSRNKTLYYMRIKKILQIDTDGPEQTLQKNISQEEYSKTDDNKSTFYLIPQLQTYGNIPSDNTIEKILSSLQRKGGELKGRTIKDIDKAFKFNHNQSKTKDRHSQQKTHLKTNPSNLISHFTYKPITKKKKQNHKSLSNEPQSQERISRGKKLATASSCMNIPSHASHDSNLNYLRRDKNLKNSQKELKVKKRQNSQICLNQSKPVRCLNQSKPKHFQQSKGSHCWHEGKGSHKKAFSNERSSDGGKIKSKSGKKRLQTQTNVKAAIDKTKNKIKMQKNMMLKKYVQSRQSYTKSIDSTCGEVGRHPRK